MEEGTAYLVEKNVMIWVQMNPEGCRKGLRTKADVLNPDRPPQPDPLENN